MGEVVGRGGEKRGRWVGCREGGGWSWCCGNRLGLALEALHPRDICQGFKMLSKNPLGKPS